MRKRTCLCVFFMIIMAISAGAQDKMTIAVLDFQPKGTSKIVAGVVTDIIRSEMIKTGLYIVIERNQMDEIIKEQSFQLTGCVEQSCAIQIGKILSARKVLMGEIGAVGSAFMITVRIVDVESGSSEFAANEKAENADALDNAAVSITRKLSQNIVEGNPDYFAVRKTLSGYYSRAIVPGWGQLYADRDVRGFIYLGLFAASAGFTAYSYYNFNSKEKEYNNVPRGSSQSEFDSKFDKKKNAGYQLLYAGIFTGAVYIASWIDVIFFSKPEFNDTAANNINNTSIYITFLGSSINCIDSPVIWLGADMHF